MGKLIFNKALQVWEGTAPNGLTIRITPEGIANANAQITNRWLAARGLPNLSAAFTDPQAEADLLNAYDDLFGPTYTLAYWLKRAG